METGTINSAPLFASLDETTVQLSTLVSSIDESVFNTIPFEDSWTVAQLATHVTKSNKAITQGLYMSGKPADRKPDEGVDKLKKMFLDFSVKFQSPAFIVPEQRLYKKEEVTNNLQSSINKLSELRNRIDLSEIIAIPPFGEITKLELLHFVLYHTQRHIHQLKNIICFLNTNERLPN